MIDVKTATTRTNVGIVVRDGKIAEVRDGLAAPAAVDGVEAKVVDLTKETCLPGLIDTHTHVLLQGDITAADYDEQLLKQSTEYRTILATVNVRRALPRFSSRLMASAMRRLKRSTKPLVCGW